MLRPFRRLAAGSAVWAALVRFGRAWSVGSSWIGGKLEFGEPTRRFVSGYRHAVAAIGCRPKPALHARKTLNITCVVPETYPFRNYPCHKEKISLAKG